MKKQAKKVVTESKLTSIMRDNYTGDDVKRYIGSVTEEFQGRVSAIAEQFLGLNYKLDTININLSNKIDSIDNRVERLEQKSDAQTQMIGRVMIDVEDIKINMHEKISREEFINFKRD